MMATADELALQGYRDAFRAVRDGFESRVDEREAVLDGLVFPVRRDEAWRFTPARKLLGSVHVPTWGALGTVPEGVVTLRDVPEHVRDCAGRVASLDGFAGLNAAFFRECAVIHTRADQAQTVRLHLTHSGLSTPRVLVFAEHAAKVQLYVEHDVRDGLAVPVIEIVALDEAEVELTHVVRGDGGHFAGQIAYGTAHDCRVALRSVLAGAEIARLDVKVGLTERARFASSGLVLGSGSQHAEHHLEIRHLGRDAVSTQLFRNVLDERCRAVFTGEVHVERDVTGSDATQSANTLLLSDDASAVARPWLVIDNDDVVASHGATVGRLDPDALFYLRSRGIGVGEAQRLLTRAFAGEVVESVPEVFREAVGAVVERYLAQRGVEG